VHMERGGGLPDGYGFHEKCSGGSQADLQDLEYRGKKKKRLMITITPGSR